MRRDGGRTAVSGISKTRDQFLQNHLGDIMSGIQDPQLRKLPPMMDCAN